MKNQNKSDNYNYAKGDIINQSGRFEIGVYKQRKEMSQINQYGYGDNIAGDQVRGDKIGTQINQSQDLVQAAKEIKVLLDQMSIDYPSDSLRVISAKAIDQVENNPELKSRILRGLKAGSFAALEEMVDHPVAQFFITGVKEVLNPSM